MAHEPKSEDRSPQHPTSVPRDARKASLDKLKVRERGSTAAKRRCVSTACIACRKRKSKCDGSTPSCAACASVYGTECVYDPNSDHRRKGVYKKDIDSLKTRNSTLQTIVHAILNFPEDQVPALVKQIRSCESLDDVAEDILTRDTPFDDDVEEDKTYLAGESQPGLVPTFETELSGKMGELRMENGATQLIGGTSNLIFASPADGDLEGEIGNTAKTAADLYPQQESAGISWTNVTSDAGLISHLLRMYFTWHYAYFTTLSRTSFTREFVRGKPRPGAKKTAEYCTPLLVNAMLALGCHFTNRPAARADPHDSATAGDHFFKEAKRLILENDEHENPKLATVQALALMSVREAGCGREAKGWVYSGMSFRMAHELGLSVDSGSPGLSDEDIDARRITFWGCFLFDKCWSNYLGRQPQLPLSSVTVPKFDVFPDEEAQPWWPYGDSGPGTSPSIPSRTRAIALQISMLCEISSDLLLCFYAPAHVEKPAGKQAELKKLGELHTRLEAWRKNLPHEFEAKEGQLPNVLLMHMFFHLLFIHLFRPFLKYNQTSSPLPANVSPRKMCTHAATMISKLLRLYRRNYGLRQICNIAVYIAHSACTIHLLNLPDKNARRDIVHGLKHLEEIAEGWLVARCALSILSILVQRWRIEVPDEAVVVLSRTDARFARREGASDYLTPTSAHSPLTPPTPQPRLEFRPPANNGPYPPMDQNTTAPIIPTGPNLADPNRMYSNHLLSPKHGAALVPQAAAPTPAHISPPPPQQQQQQQQQQELPRLPNPSPNNTISWPTDPASGIPPPPPPLNPIDRGEQTSPTMLFSGEQSTIESQDWWLQDQHTLASGFNNWMTFNSEDLRIMEDNLESAFEALDGAPDWREFGE